ncbi:Iff5 GPI-anchored protein [Candida orthopsilosis Co 90-125]|uniref:Iff5 GPI-anchored protein n=1 Tax=Candida orthopsilosis (strain 90-125) TaxID=1136231 RepID=H8X3L1_CANO9|nr:Iff5 GPI-anchored protein [Candida orthopsilosis Co 90-125]CCG25649.1 Iff5 GPI-anchored protein [Candida orthopsilosis Co 90-125]
MLIISKQYLVFCFLLPVVLGLDITSNTVDRGAVSFNVGDITVHSGAYWSIINNAVSAFVSSLNVQSNAGLFISSTSPLLSLQVTLLGLLNSITNNGIISFNSLASLTSSNYNLIGLSFENNGEMYLGASGVVASNMGITAASWKNTGLLVFYQNQRNEGYVNLGTALGAISNNGQICFHNEVYQQTTTIAGTGCITADADSSIYITNAALSVSTGQTFYLADGKSSMIVQALSTPQTFNVRNFGQVNGVANKIGLTIPLFALIGNPWSYNSATGVLTLKGAGLLSQYFNIGTGYDSSKFQVVTDNGAGLPSTLLGSIQYNGPVPNPGLPSQCRVCKSLPQIPGAQPTEYTTTITTTSDGHTLTETGIVDITTDTAGSWYTTTSIFTTASTFTTEYTTTGTTTKDDGSVETDSGIVSQSGDSLTTITTFPPGSVAGDVTTEYTTTWTTTKDDGSLETDSGIVSQSGDSLTTITTFPPGSVAGDVTTEYTTTWTTTKDDGSVETDSGIVSQSGDSLTTITTFPPGSVAGDVTMTLTSNFLPDAENSFVEEFSTTVYSSLSIETVLTGIPTEQLPTGAESVAPSGSSGMNQWMGSPINAQTEQSCEVGSAETVTNSGETASDRGVSTTSGEMAGSSPTDGPVAISDAASIQGGSELPYESHTSGMTTLTEHTSGLHSTAVAITTYLGAGTFVRYPSLMCAFASLVFVLF